MTSQSATYLFNTGSQSVAAVDDRALSLQLYLEGICSKQLDYLKEDPKTKQEIQVIM